jgi:hypothetical protein
MLQHSSNSGLTQRREIAPLGLQAHTVRPN